jgi:CxxC motif-containing protein
VKAMNIIEKKCKVCPVGCNLKIIQNNTNPSTYTVEGNSCNRGKEFGIKEVLEPSRVLTSRVLLKNGPMSRLPVKTNGVISENLVDKCMEIIKITEISAPVEKGQIIIENILDTGVDVIAARKVNRI